MLCVPLMVNEDIRAIFVIIICKSVDQCIVGK